MDEPSSALDALHEKELLHTLNTEYGGERPCFSFLTGAAPSPAATGS